MLRTPLKILFAVDFRAGCEHAAEDLLDLSRSLPLDITVMHVFNENYFEANSILFPEAALKLQSMQADLRGRVEKRLQTWSEDHLGKGNFKTEVEFGHPGDIFSVRSKDFDWLVLGMNKHNLFERIFITSTAESVLGHCFCPTLVLKKKFSGNSKAVVLLDLGDHPKELIARSVTWAKEMGISSLDYYVYYPMPVELAAFAAPVSMISGGGDFDALLGDLMEATKKLVSEYAQGLETTVRVRKVAAATEGSDIAHDINEVEVPVVVGRRKRSKISELFLGSVTATLLRSTPVDLVILPINN